MVRADAERNIEAILAAGQRLLSGDPGASVAEVAKAAGVGRVTLYGHFPSREDLVAAVLTRAIAEADQALDDPELATLPAPDALARLVSSSWEILNRHSRLFIAADRTLPTERIRERHAEPLKRVEGLIERGRESGDFRTDVPVSWQVSSFFALLHTAAQEVEAARLVGGEAGGVLVTSLRSLLSARSPSAG
ncbi:TetR/AcrR family transcriptional regulator [Nonomuraea endophytica]|uniref:AcrR family transcriptional regulator n=1 Tax=Nonomuraea endophytica TaxID=714136 RepID=A0A7W8EMC7_9ACTN|nr:TetR/AcrR family transcriptional regulator [Nonomuraea endophytica]MBB5084551.1 AcrR family transcriptional regulator [Nonomuraea endophytica]